MSNYKPFFDSSNRLAAVFKMFARTMTSFGKDILRQKHFPLMHR